MHKKIQFSIKVAIIATFFAPLIVLPESFIFPFIVPKILFIRSLILILLGLYILLLASDWQTFRPKVTPLSITTTLFLVSVGLSTFVGVDWYRSFWDNHERMLGFFTIMHYGIYFFIISSIVKTWAEWRQLFWWFLAAGSAVMFIGVLQKANPDLLLNRGADRVSATLGNAIYYSGYGLFLLFVGMLLFATEQGVKWKKYVALVGAALGFLGIFLGGTRGTLVALIAALGIICLSYAIGLKDRPRIRQVCAALTVLGVVAIGLIFSFRQTEFVRSIPAIGRLANTSLVNDSASTRIMAWKVAVTAWQAKPVLGWGPNNFYYAFNLYYPPEFLRHGWGETWFDNAHNVVMNTLSTQGILGIITYFGLFGVGIWSLWRAYRQRQISIHVAVLGTGFFVGHFFHNIFVFENPTSYLYFFFFLAWVSQYTALTPAVAPGSKRADSRMKPVSVGLAVTVGLITLLTIYSTDVRPKQANNASFNTIQAIYQRPNEAMELYKAALEIPSPHIDDIRNDTARAIASLIPELVKAGRIEEAKAWNVLAYETIEKNLILHPLDIRVSLQLGQLAEQRYDLFQDPTFMTAAENIYTEALTKSPKRQQIQFALALVKLRLAKTDEAIQLAETARNNDPAIGESWWRLAWIYGAAQERDKAEATIAEAEAKGVTFDAQGQAAIKDILGVRVETSS